VQIGKLWLRHVGANFVWVLKMKKASFIVSSVNFVVLFRYSRENARLLVVFDGPVEKGYPTGFFPRFIHRHASGLDRGTCIEAISNLLIFAV
jgi:hypothetical protein